ncbi:Gfo/Idh/MocA family oxidoreductase [bacterium]|nr:MAG: Gfo/Idh/MocA family oxidoreductase [bacterium]
MEPVRFGVVGVGGMGGSHARSFAQMPEATLVAVADVSEQTAQKVAEETGARAFADASSMLASGEVEAVLIATPHFFHAPVALDAASKGIHVLSEKPISVSVSTADEMIAACAAANVLLGVMFQQRTAPTRVTMKAMIDSGELGTLHRIAMTAPWYRTQAYYNSGAWRGTWKGEGGGILMNQAPHSLDQFVWLMGQTPKAVQAICDTRLHDIEVENLAVAICDFGDGKTGQFYASTSDVPSGERVEIIGDRGMLCLDDHGLRFLELETSLEEHLKTATGGFETPKRAWRDIPTGGEHQNHATVTAAFARAIRENDPSLMIANGEDGRDALELANAILMAGYKRREVPLPLDRSEFDTMLKNLQDGATPASLRA